MDDDDDGHQLPQHPADSRIVAGRGLSTKPQYSLGKDELLKFFPTIPSGIQSKQVVMYHPDRFLPPRDQYCPVTIQKMVCTASDIPKQYCRHCNKSLAANPDCKEVNGCKNDCMYCGKKHPSYWNEVSKATLTPGPVIDFLSSPALQPGTLSAWKRRYTRLGEGLPANTQIYPSSEQYQILQANGYIDPKHTYNREGLISWLPKIGPNGFTHSLYHATREAYGVTTPEGLAKRKEVANYQRARSASTRRHTASSTQGLTNFANARKIQQMQPWIGYPPSAYGVSQYGYGMGSLQPPMQPLLIKPPMQSPMQSPMLPPMLPPMHPYMYPYMQPPEPKAMQQPVAPSYKGMYPPTGFTDGGHGGTYAHMHEGNYYAGKSGPPSTTVTEPVKDTGKKDQRSANTEPFTPRTTFPPKYFHTPRETDKSTMAKDECGRKRSQKPSTNEGSKRQRINDPSGMRSTTPVQRQSFQAIPYGCREDRQWKDKSKATSSTQAHSDVGSLAAIDALNAQYAGADGEFQAQLKPISHTRAAFDALNAQYAGADGEFQAQLKPISHTRAAFDALNAQYTGAEGSSPTQPNPRSQARAASDALNAHYAGGDGDSHAQPIPTLQGRAPFQALNTGFTGVDGDPDSYAEARFKRFNHRQS